MERRNRCRLHHLGLSIWLQSVLQVRLIYRDGWLTSLKLFENTVRSRCATRTHYWGLLATALGKFELVRAGYRLNLTLVVVDQDMVGDIDWILSVSYKWLLLLSENLLWIYLFRHNSEIRISIGRFCARLQQWFVSPEFRRFHHLYHLVLLLLFFSIL